MIPLKNIAFRTNKIVFFIMYFTKAQIRALWFVVIVFAAALLYHSVTILFMPKPAYDFSAFEKKFYAKRDSILAAQNDSTGSPAQPSPPPKMQKANSGKPEKAVFLVNINSATSEQLQALPRIGPKMAQRIVRYRQEHGKFRRKQDLMKVKGIGKKSFEKLRELITVE
ncbi:MAG TPA: hypothetical protein ENK14_11250 [Caldithrix sp.]|nr:hypothetical protein [Caldithrix sp.]